MKRRKEIVVLGITGSIGSSALKGISMFPDSLKITGASVHSNIEKAVAICKQFNIPNLCITSQLEIPDIPGIKIFRDTEEMIQSLAPDTVLNGISGSAGLDASVKVVKHGITLALANKETIVLGGTLFLDFAKQHNSKVIPVDSEHSALDQLITDCGRENISSLVITASGGPFLNTPFNELELISPSRAASHPTWNMGPKISIDSSTLANKGLEVIEAHYLFGFSPEKIEVVIHPQSIVHSMVRTHGGQIYAQLSRPDMVFPIMRALTDNKLDRPVGKPLDFDLLNLNFSKPDFTRFPLLAYAFECIKLGGIYPVVYNIADEIAVRMFTEGKIKYTQIQTIIRAALNKSWTAVPGSLEDLGKAIEEIKGKLS